jgi:isocitrate lyase
VDLAFEVFVGFGGRRRLDDLRRELQARRDEAARLTRSVQEERQHAELASASKSVVQLFLSVRAALRQLGQLVLFCREEAFEVAETLSSKEGEFAQQTEQTRVALAAMAELESAVARVERVASRSFRNRPASRSASARTRSRFSSTLSLSRR